MWPAYPKWENPIVGFHYHTARTRLFNFELLSGEKTDFHTGLFPMTYSKIDNPGDVRKITYYQSSRQRNDHSFYGVKIEGTKIKNGMFKKDTREVLCEAHRVLTGYE